MAQHWLDEVIQAIRELGDMEHWKKFMVRLKKGQ